MCKLNIFDKLSFLFVFIGSLNWGLIGLLDFNLVKALTLNITALERLIYIIVFASSLELLSLIFRCDIVKLED